MSIYFKVGRRPKAALLREGFCAVSFVLSLFLFFSCALLPVHAADDDLVDVLVQKGVITSDEASRLKYSEHGAKKKPVLDGWKFETLGYVDYSAGKSPLAGGSETSYNRFGLTRGYLTAKRRFGNWIAGRMTVDIHRDTTGDYKERLKYLYAELAAPDMGIFTGMKAEIGLGHMPWLDFEEHINPYRCQGTMAIERAGVFNSADEGISIRGDFGGKLENAVARTGNHHYDGRYGSWHIGVYNGPGYHESENNNNKVIEGRITVRPLPSSLPGLQLSYLAIFGEGNKKAAAATDYPDYKVNLGMVSYEHPLVILTAQYFATEGQKSGKWVDAAGEALSTEGYSFFGNLKLSAIDPRLSIFARYDRFDPDSDDKIAQQTDYEMYIAGLSYDFYKGNMLVIDYETTDYGKDSAGKGALPVAGTNLGDEKKLQVVWQVKL